MLTASYQRRNERKNVKKKVIWINKWTFLGFSICTQTTFMNRNNGTLYNVYIKGIITPKQYAQKNIESRNLYYWSLLSQIVITITYNCV